MTDGSADLPKPSSLDQAHAILLRLLTADQVAEFRSDPEEAAVRHHRGLGRFIRNEWLRHGPLCGAFAGLGRLSFDDMSGLVLRSFGAKLRGHPFDLGSEAKREVGDASDPVP